MLKRKTWNVTFDELARYKLKENNRLEIRKLENNEEYQYNRRYTNALAKPKEIEWRKP